MTATVDQPGLFDAPFVQPVMPKGATLAERFAAFDEANPHVYLAIERQCVHLWGRGEKRIGIGAVIEDLRRGRIRTQGDDYKLNNSFRAFYARKVVKRCPFLFEIIEMRKSQADQEEGNVS